MMFDSSTFFAEFWHRLYWLKTPGLMPSSWYDGSYCQNSLENIGLYITHKNIPVILLVNTTSRDIKYYAYIPDI